MYQVSAEPMPNNPAKGYLGTTSGLWMVVIEDLGERNIPKYPTRTINKENLEYEEAQRIAQELENKLNAA